MDNFTFNEKKHAYFLDDKPLQGVTSVLSVISKPALIQWSANESIIFLRENGVEYDQEGVQYFKCPSAFLEQARKAHLRKKEKAAEQGTDTHAEIEKYVNECIEKNGGDPIVNVFPEGIKTALQSFQGWAIKEDVKFIASEKRMYSKELWVAGTCDLVLQIGDKTFIADIKTYKKIWDRVPHIQMAAYALMYKEMTGEDIDGTLIINIPKETSIVEAVPCYDLLNDIEGFKAALTLYRTINN